MWQGNWICDMVTYLIFLRHQWTWAFKICWNMSWIQLLIFIYMLNQCWISVKYECLKTMNSVKNIFVECVEILLKSINHSFLKYNDTMLKLNYWNMLRYEWVQMLSNCMVEICLHMVICADIFWHLLRSLKYIYLQICWNTHEPQGWNCSHTLMYADMCWHHINAFIYKCAIIALTYANSSWRISKYYKYIRRQTCFQAEVEIC
jgi:hypothetical protein